LLHTPKKTDTAQWLAVYLGEPICLIVNPDEETPAIAHSQIYKFLNQKPASVAAEVLPSDKGRKRNGVVPGEGLEWKTIQYPRRNR
jgi:hypothetical protein